MNLSAEELGNVNTVALVMYNFTSEKLFRKLTLEKAEHLTRITPNLLVAIGLLGTFLGITMNLSSVASGLMEIDSSATTTISLTDLIERLKQPLEGMAVAFVSSFFCLILGILVTLANSFLNTDLAKQYLLSELEFRLDKLAGQRQNPTGRLIQSISDNFRIFLDNFQVTVRDAIERPLEREMSQLRQMNQENVKLANDIFMRFDSVSGTFIVSSQTFERAVDFLQEIVLSEQFSRAVRQLSQLIQAVDKASQTQINLQRIAEQFDNITNSLDHILAILGQLPNSLESINQNLAEASNLNQERITSIIDNLGVLMTLSRDNQETYNQLLARLESINQNLAEASNLNQERITSIVDNLGVLMTLSRDNQETYNQLLARLESINQNLAEASNLNQERITSIVDNLGVLMTLSRDNQETYNQLLARLERVNQSVVEASSLNQQEIIRSINKMQELIVSNLEFQKKLSAYFDNLSAMIAKVVNQGVNQFRVQEFTNEQMDESDDKIC
ncbi:hypothetical protein LQF76_01540 [Gloeomargaritales cyanobacterium VI4D9]|nr:hypothetical protein LQF76_01540 [Gloeomargaritales cyanobacterium VI4D9]